MQLLLVIFTPTSPFPLYLSWYVSAKLSTEVLSVMVCPWFLFTGLSWLPFVLVGGFLSLPRYLPHTHVLVMGLPTLLMGYWAYTWLILSARPNDVCFRESPLRISDRYSLLQWRICNFLLISLKVNLGLNIKYDSCELMANGAFVTCSLEHSLDNVGFDQPENGNFCSHLRSR